MRVSTVYRYFPSKDDPLRAAIAGSMLQFEALIAEVGSNEKASTAAAYLRLLLDTLRRFRRHTEGVDWFTLAIQGWAHAQARPQTTAIITESFARQLESYRHAALRWTTRAKAEAAAQAIAAAVVGYVVQSAFSDTEIDVGRYSGQNETVIRLLAGGRIYGRHSLPWR
jgi:AcrR family transcriptional regulator